MAKKEVVNKTCLNCKYEPDWGEMTKGTYPRRSGRCKHPIVNRKLKVPAVMSYHFKSVIRYDDDSGIHVNYCKTWEPKDKK